MMNYETALALLSQIQREVKPEMDVQMGTHWAITVFDPLTGREVVVESPEQWERARHIPAGFYPKRIAGGAE